MSYRLDPEAQLRLQGYVGRIGNLLLNKNQRTSFALYMLGLFGESPRKSLEPLAAQLCPHPDQVDALHQRLQHFLVDSPWSDREIRREASRYALEAMTQREKVTAWILDDTGFLKQGEHSVGVQRQYTGSAGKVTNCQIGVSLSVATRTAHLPIDFELYLPKTWTDDEAQRKKAHLPRAVHFRTKPELALMMLQRAREDGVCAAPVLADSAFGDNQAFRTQVREMGLDYGVGIHGPTKVVVIGRKGQRGEAVSVQDLAAALGEQAFETLLWREGTRKKLQARFAFRRVVVPQDPAQEPQWLVMEWPEGEAGPSKFYLCTLPVRSKRKELVRLLKERYRTEQVYEELKGELGLDHYEGRRYPGWCHHISTVLCCYAFVVAERERLFPPCAPRARRTPQASPQRHAA